MWQLETQLSDILKFWYVFRWICKFWMLFHQSGVSQLHAHMIEYQPWTYNYVDKFYGELLFLPFVFGIILKRLMLAWIYGTDCYI